MFNCSKTIVATVASAAVAVTLSAGAAPASAALLKNIDTVLIFDPLDGSGTPGSGTLHNTAPTDRTGGIGSDLWDADETTTTPFQSDGTINTGQAAGAWIAFTPMVGNIYQLSATLNTTAGDAQWNALGFTSGGDSTQTFNGDGGFGNMLLRQERDPFFSNFANATIDPATAFPGEDTGGGVAFDVGTGAIDYAIILDATDADSANWTMAFYADGTQVLGPTTAASGNFNTINHVGLSTLENAAGTVSDFQLATLIIPEPASLALLGLGSALILGGRRRSA